MKSAYENDRVQADEKGFLTALEYSFFMEPHAYREITQSVYRGEKVYAEE